MNGQTLSQRARAYAAKAHEGQTRKYTGEPYVNHPARVARMVSVMTDAKDPILEEIVAVAYLHDTLEKCPSVTEAELHAEFGPIVAEGVMWLTNIAHRKGNRGMRGASDAARLAKAPLYVKTIKLAELIDNGPSIVENDPELADVWLAETRLLLLSLLGGDRRLWMRAEEWLDQQQMSASTP